MTDEITHKGIKAIVTKVLRFEILSEVMKMTLHEQKVEKAYYLNGAKLCKDVPNDVAQVMK